MKSSKAFAAGHLGTATTADANFWDGLGCLSTLYLQKRTERTYCGTYWQHLFTTLTRTQPHTRYYSDENTDADAEAHPNLGPYLTQSASTATSKPTSSSSRRPLSRSHSLMVANLVPWGRTLWSWSSPVACSCSSKEKNPMVSEMSTFSIDHRHSWETPEAMTHEYKDDPYVKERYHMYGYRKKHA